MSAVEPLGSYEADLEAALGSVLSQDVEAPFDLPRFANSAMDGYALRTADLADLRSASGWELLVAGAVEAGQTWPGGLPARSAIRIGTGGAVPQGADAVVPSEVVERTDAAIRSNARVSPHSNIREQGDDIRAGSIAVPRDTLLRPQEIALLAALGVERLPTVRRPRVSILSIGPELMAGAQPASVPDANGPMLASLAVTAGAATAGMEPLAGEPAELLEMLNQLAIESDLILTSGAISDGPADTLRPLLAEKSSIELWDVRLRPGKHFAAGKLDRAVLLSLPGNPIAALAGFILFGEPVIARLSGRPAESAPTMAVARQPITGARGRMHAVRSSATLDAGGQLTVTPADNRGSAVISSLRAANCLALVPEHRDLIQPGEAVEIRWIGVSMTEFGMRRSDD